MVKSKTSFLYRIRNAIKSIWHNICIIFSSPAEETRSIVILGTEGAGKTTLWQKLQGNNTPVKLNTSIENINSFTLQRNDKQKITITATKDIGGGENFVGKYYNELIQKDTFIYFLFNFNRLSEDQKIIRARIEKILFVAQENTYEYLGLMLMATHLDIYEQKNGPISEAAARDVVYRTLNLRELFDKHKNSKINFNFDPDKSIKVINLLDRKAIENIKQSIINIKKS